ncbi:pellicle/biofilm biosynthesis outer membrane protein PelC [Oceanisphaera marina]|uniref:Pellicle/biofilm biosynthesis outer membrane protein PelC n=1 Tax=Oceanisphaera marina TaxID=2017550 RepID=A0ABQ1IKA8_9GAMM|nr:hypothetical protein [Oceanisphaera marina]GGB44690.1 pellicle/biofilm biosynthesis outer membrane protein PelC [Oceanisphaera marina]
MKKIWMLVSTLALSACSHYQVPESPNFPANSRWAIMPMVNNSSTPMAAEKAEQILGTHLYARGINATLYPASDVSDLASILDNNARRKSAQAWLVSQNVDYVITGSVEEWHYKSGLDGEPAVGITLEVQSAGDNVTQWRASGARSGWGRESVSSAGQKVIDELLNGLNVEQGQ